MIDDWIKQTKWCVSNLVAFIVQECRSFYTLKLYVLNNDHNWSWLISKFYNYNINISHWHSYWYERVIKDFWRKSLDPQRTQTSKWVTAIPSHIKPHYMYTTTTIANHWINLGCSGEKWMRYAPPYMYTGLRSFIIIIKWLRWEAPLGSPDITFWGHFLFK